MKLRELMAIVIIFLVFITINDVAIAIEEMDFEVESFDLQIYRDGLVHVSEIILVNDTFPAITVPLLNSSVSNFIVLDENQSLLDYVLDESNLTVFTLGTEKVSIEYDTNSLTRKNFEEWSLIVNTTYNLTVLLPEGSSIVYMNEIPSSIDLEDKKITLSLFPSAWEISYILSTSVPGEFNVSDLNILPFNAIVGEEVTISVLVTNLGVQSGSFSLPLIVNQTIQETRTVSLAGGESKKIDFKIIKQFPGTYSIEVEGLIGTLFVNSLPSTGIPTEYLIIIAFILVAIFLALIVIIKRRKVNVDKIFRDFPQLNTEEKNVILFLSENERKAFESQIRERFPEIPRTSLWRLVKRLEKLEIIKVNKIGLENQVELRK
ncbi:MAG: CARDB domain-containing protein [Candidatus Bathyarchaeota archaeon]